MTDIRYVAAFPESDNWLGVKLDNGDKISLPYGLKLAYHGAADGRERFTILEGVHKGKAASVVKKSATSSYLTEGLHHLPGGLIRFDSKSQRLTFDNKGPYNAFSGAGPGVEGGVAVTYTPVPPGSYPLAIPAYPSAQTRPQYSQWTRMHKTWFRIGLSTHGSRFLHAGEISDGCVTVRQFLYDGEPSTHTPAGFRDLENNPNGPQHGLIGLPLPAHPAPVVSFDAIYNYLILRRLNDQAVGTLQVTANGSL